jgi:dihydropteroate synthase
MPRPHILFVTGKLAEPALRRLLADLAGRAGFDYSVAVLPITVAALATTPWVARHLRVPAGVDRLVLPGLCGGDVAALASVFPGPVERGPKDLRELPEFFGAGAARPAGYGAYDIEILAEINHAPRLPLADLVAWALKHRADGADVIDLGCDPAGRWEGIGAAVRALREEGLRVSVDSFDRVEVGEAVQAGAELVLSVNGSNREAARDWGCEVVAMPDVATTLEGLDETVAFLDGAGVRFRIDPVIEPVGFGLAESLGRYLEVRRRYPQAPMLMGVGNLTELTDVDSSGINVLLLGFCQELGIRSILTTEVINWCRSSVRELDMARRLVYHACRERVLPKHLEPGLVMLRDPRLREHGVEALRELAAGVKDRNFRLFAEGGRLHLFNGRMYLEGTDPFALIAEVQSREAIDPSHAFYLGYEMAKAVTALTLGKNYVQDQALSWGLLTVPEAPYRGTIRESPEEGGLESSGADGPTPTPR